MKFKGKELRVILSKDAIAQYKELNKLVDDELKKGIKSSHNQTILKSIKRVSDWLKENPFTGDQVQKNLIPKKYVEDYEITNLWRIELSDYWRLIYTIKSDEVEIISFVLDICDHDKYNEIFGYKKR